MVIWRGIQRNVIPDYGGIGCYLLGKPVHSSLTLHFCVPTVAAWGGHDKTITRTPQLGLPLPHSHHGVAADCVTVGRHGHIWIHGQTQNFGWESYSHTTLSPLPLSVNQYPATQLLLHVIAVHFRWRSWGARKAAVSILDFTLCLSTEHDKIQHCARVWCSVISSYKIFSRIRMLESPWDLASRHIMS